MLTQEAKSVGAAGTTVTSGAASANASLPTDAAGRNPKICLFTCNSAGGSLYVKIGQAGLTATANDIAITFGAPQVLKTVGCTTFAYIQEVAASKLNVIPLEF